MNKIKLLFLILIFALVSVNAQSITATIGSVSGATVGSVITIPINVTGFSNIGSISMSLLFDSSVLTPYPDGNTLASNVNSAVSTALIKATSSKVNIGWYSSNPATIASGKLCDLSFTYKGGSTAISFKLDDCDMSYSNLTPVTGVVYTNGSVSGSGTVIPSAPVLISPTTGSTGVSQNPTLTWNTASGATSYNIQVSTSSDFSTTVVSTSTTSTSYIATGLAQGTKYYWHVSASNSAGTSLYSTTWDFTTLSSGQPPAAPSIVSPTNGSTGVQVSPTLIWGSVTGAVSYSLQVSTSASFLNPIVNQTGLSSTSYTLGVLSPNTIYYWRVAAVNASGTSGYTAASFTTTSSQVTPVLSIGSTTATVGDVINVPINVTNFTNIGSVSLLVQFDPTVLTYQGTFNWDSNFPLGASNASGNRITIGWFSATPGSIVNGKLVDLRFTYKGGTSPLTVITGSGNTEIADQFGSALVVTYNNGSVTPFVGPQVPSVPVLLSPVNNAVNASVTPTLMWNTANGATTYNIQVSTNSTFTNIIASQTGLTTTSFTSPALNAGVQYFWHVSATNNVGTSNYSDTWNFTTAAPIPAAPVLTAPVNGATGISTIPTLSWNSSSGATSYNVIIAANSSFTSPIVNVSGITSTTYVPSGLSYSTQYYWKVSATNGSGTSSYSTVWSFTTGAPVVPAASLAALTAKVGDTVSVALNLSNFVSIGAISFNIQYDPAVLQYVGMTNWDSQLGSAFGNNVNGKVIIGWFAATPANAFNLASGKMVDIKFKYLGGTSALTFMQDCDVQNITSNSVTVTYSNGSVSPYVGPTVPAVPVLSSPAEGATGLSVNPTLTWQAATGADSYNVLVATDAAFANVVFSLNNIVGTSTTVSTGLAGLTKYYWKVSATNTIGTSAFSTVRNFTTGEQVVLQAPVLLTPANGASGVSLMPTLTWSPVNGATHYNLQIATDPQFVNLILTQNGISYTGYTVFDIANNMTYYWRVAATNGIITSPFSGAWTFNTGLVAPSVPVLASPANNATGLATTTVLSWNASTNADSYNVEVSTNPDFTTVFVSKTGVTATSVSVSGLANGTLYYWRVNAKNSVGTSAFSIIRSFTTIVALPASPVLVSPANGSQNIPMSTSFTWNAVQTADSYTFQIAQDAAFTLNVQTISDITTLQTAQQLAANTTYFWRVAAKNAAGLGAFSSAWSFKTIVLPPDVPELALPADNSVKIPVNPVLKWKKAARADSYGIKIATDANFTNVIVDVKNIVDTFYSASGLLNSQQYFWKVNATNTNSSSAYSTARSFTTIIAKPSVPVIIAPANNAFNVPLSAVLSWNPADRAVSYNLQVSTDPNFSTYLVNETGITLTSVTLNDLSGNVNYFWKVSATNDGGTSEFTSVFNFTTVSVFKLSGSVKYYNTANTPLKDVTVKVTSVATGNSVTAVTNAEGLYNVNNVQAGKYVITAAKTGNWGGSNSADALLIGKHFTQIDTLDLLQLMAADVSNNYIVNSSDAFLISQRFTNLISAFPNSKPEWLFKLSTKAGIKNVPYNTSVGGADTVTVTSSDLTANLLGLCAGDVNKSYTPAALAKTNLVAINNTGVKKISSRGVFEVPVTVADYVNLGALSLKLSYAKELVDYKGIKLNKNLTNAFCNEEDGTISISWANMSASKSIELDNNSVLFTLQFAVKKDAAKTGSVNVELLSGSELNDINGNALKINISAPQVEVKLPDNYSLDQNYPNPFNPATVIKYSVPSKSEVKIKVYNTLGMVVKELVNGVMETGTYETSFNASNLASGVYLYSIEAKSLESANGFKTVKKMMLIK